MNTILKIVSPKIDLKRFFDGTDPSLVIKDLDQKSEILTIGMRFIFIRGNITINKP